MLFNNKLKIAIVTGATKGAGKEITKMFIKNNCNVIITSRKNSLAQTVANEINNMSIHSHATVKGFELDFLNLKNNKLLHLLQTNHIIPNFLINNASSFDFNNINHISNKNIDTLFKVNVIGPLILSKYCLNIINNNNNFGAILFYSPPYFIDDKTTYLLPYMQSKLAQTTLMKSISNANLNNNSIVSSFWNYYPLSTDSFITNLDNSMDPSILSKTLEILLFHIKVPTYYNSKIIIDHDFLIDNGYDINTFKINNNKLDLLSFDDTFFKFIINNKNIKFKKNLF